jgi:hypothetical protein
MTCAKQHLDLVQPLGFFRTHQHRFGSGHTIGTGHLPGASLDHLVGPR